MNYYVFEDNSIRRVYIEEVEGFMYKIVAKQQLNKDVYRFEIEAEKIAKKVHPGQFVILHLDEKGERFPLTVSDYDALSGTITLIVQAIGYQTCKLAAMQVEDSILNVVGPLGNPTEFGDAQRVCVVGGGVGCAIAYPSAKHLYKNGIEVDVVAGFRNQDMIILEEEMKAASCQCIITTDDGSNGTKGFVTDQLDQLIKMKKYDLVIAIGPVRMMQAICNLTKLHQIKTIVSLNPIMIDGTGMCGGCRVTIDGQVRFACVDGPDFDGHLVDFEELVLRNSTFRQQEIHACKIGGKVDA